MTSRIAGALRLAFLGLVAVAALGCSPTVSDIASLAGSGGSGATSAGGNGGNGSDETRTPLSSVPGSTVGPGTLAVTGALSKVTHIVESMPIPYAFKAVRTGPSTASLVGDQASQTDYGIGAWPPVQEKGRILFDGPSDSFDVVDNGDFTYAYLGLSWTDPNEMFLAPRVVTGAAPSVTKWKGFDDQVGLPILARQGDENFITLLAFGMVDKSSVSLMARASSSSVTQAKDPVRCDPTQKASVGSALGLGDHFLAVVGGSDATCDAPKDDAERTLTLVTTSVTGPVAPSVTSTITLADAPLYTFLKPRSGGAFLIAVRAAATDVFRIDGNGTPLGVPTTIDSDAAFAIALLDVPAADVLLMPDGGLLFVWLAKGVPGAASPLEIARFDANGALIARGETGVGHHRYTSALSLLHDGDRTIVFLGLGVGGEDDEAKAGRDTEVFALALSE